MRYTEYKHPRKQLTYKHEHFDSISDLTTHLNNTTISPLFKGHSLSSRSTYSPQWYGTNSYEEAQELLKGGWVPESEKLAKKLPLKVNTERHTSTRPTHSVVGYQASVPRYLQGIPENMINSKPTPKKQKIITIYKTLSYNQNIRADQIEQEGIKAIQIIQALEGRGYRVKLVMAWVTTSDNEVAVCTLVVKKPEERLSLIKMAFPLVHPSMLRRIGFAWIEQHQTLKTPSFTRGYGRGDWSLFIANKPGEIVLPEFIPANTDYSFLK